MSDNTQLQEVICIVCPKGCHLKVSPVDFTVTGGSCEKGSDLIRCPVRTNGSIPKGKIMAAMEEINKVALKAPVRVGEVVIPDILGTGVDVIATRDI